MQRRAFLKLGLFGGGLLAAFGGGLALWPSRRRYAPTRALLAVEASRFCVLAAVAARMIAAPSVDPVEVAHRVDQAVALTPPEVAADFNKLLGLVESGLAGLLLDGRPRPFTHLDGDQQDAALRAFRDSRLVLRRTGYGALRKICAAACYGDPAVWSDIGYPGPPVIPLDVALDPGAPVASDGGAR